MTAEAFVARADRMAAYLETTDPAENEARLRALIERIAKPDADGAPVPFETFRGTVESLHFGDIGRPSCRERVCQSVVISVGAVSLKNKKQNHLYHSHHV